MKETVLITGAHGLMARHLALKLKKDFKVKTLSTHPDAPGMFRWDIEAGQVDPEALQGVDHIVHLSGAKFYDGKAMTEERKAISRNSRIGAAQLLLEKLKQNGQNIKSFISSSAAGFYDFDAGISILDENGPSGNNDNAALCKEWEAAADEFFDQKIAGRVVKFRNSAVLAEEGGLLKQFTILFEINPSLLEQQKNEHYLPWIHIDDMTDLLASAVKGEQYRGVYNNAANDAVSMKIFIDKLIGKLKGTKLTEHADYNGVRISSDRVKAAGFSFKYNDLDAAVNDLIPDRL